MWILVEKICHFRHGEEVKILHVILTHDMGGSERYAAELATLQANAGHSVRVLVRPQVQGKGIRTLLHQPVQVAELGRWFQTWHLRKHVQHFAPDVIHAHLGKAARLVGRAGFKVPTVATLHLNYQAKNYSKLGGLIRMAEWQAADMQSYAGLSTTIGGWSQPLRPVTDAEKVSFRQAHHIPITATLVGAVGRLHPYKGFDTLINVFAQSAPATAHLVLVGEGDDRARLQALIAASPAAKRIHLAGFVADMAVVYRAMDVMVSASHSEAFGLTLVEGMFGGCPIIATATQGACAVLAGQPATLVPVGDAAALGAALAEALANGTPKRVKYPLDAFLADKQAQKVEAFYKKVIKATIE
ncbi:MAG: glycosyltransferase [Alphaproteobacteria bacterium]